jgi:hypothetical protein
MTRLREWWAANKARYEQVVEEYGGMALATYLALFATTFALFFVGIERGVDPAGAVGSAGTVGAAYLATKATQPFRIVATVVVTPLVVRIFRRIRREEAKSP